MAFPGIPGGPGGPFDFSALQNALNDPSIKQLAEQIATDPTFKDMTEQLQKSMGGMFPGGEGAPAAPNPEEAARNFDPSQYMTAMNSMFQNQKFLEMAESLGKAIISADPNMANMMKSMQDPSYKADVETKMKGLKEDPELGPILAEMESAGPMGMMKYWNDPAIMAKLGKAMGGTFDFEALTGAAAVGAGAAEEEEEEAEEAEDSVHSAASTGDVDLLKKLVAEGADVGAADDEGRTALHFACGYGELECAVVLIDAGAGLDTMDDNKNTALHYAAGYGQAASVELLLARGADKDAKNSDGKTALEVAQLNSEESDLTDVIKLLEAAK